MSPLVKAAAGSASKGAGVKVAALKSLLTYIGSETGGRRDALVRRLERDLGVGRLPRAGGGGKSVRILSVDMGIRNLAFCVADVQTSGVGGVVVEKREGKTGKAARAARAVPCAWQTSMDVKAWRRLDVLEEVGALNAAEPRTSKATGSGEQQRTEQEQEEAEEDPYSPSALSATAYALLKHTLLPYRPDVILIERQRWRSGNSASILQWTVRVNTLESMLWAILTSFREEGRVLDGGEVKGKDHVKGRKQQGAFEIFSADPKRVARFWVGPNVREIASSTKKTRAAMPSAIEKEQSLHADATPAKKPSRSKVEKMAKIRLLRSWLAMEPPHTVAAVSELDPVFPRIEFTFQGEAEATREELCTRSSAGNGRGKSGVKKETVSKKVDDVTDCFLQVAAWVAWEGNRVQIGDQKWDEVCLQGGQNEDAVEVQEKVKKSVKPRKRAAKKDGKSAKEI